MLLTKKIKMKKLTLLLLVSAFTIAGFAQAKKKHPLSGRIYAITLIEESDKKKKPEPINDNMSFLAGEKFNTNFMSQAQFPQTDYQCETDSTSGTPIYKFTVESKNADEGRFSWEGTVEGDNISGTAIIRKKGKIIHTYNFTGTHKNKKKVIPAPKVVAPVTDSTAVKTDSTKAE